MKPKVISQNTRTVKMDGNLIELVKSVRNRCKIFLIICEHTEASTLVATLLEDAFEDMQEIITYCVHEGGEPSKSLKR